MRATGRPRLSNSQTMPMPGWATATLALSSTAIPSGPRLGSLANRPAFVTFPLSPIGSIQISPERVAATKTTFSDLLSAIPLGLGTLSKDPIWIWRSPVSDRLSISLILASVAIGPRSN